MCLRVSRGPLAQTNGLKEVAHVGLAVERVLFHFHTHWIGEPLLQSSRFHLRIWSKEWAEVGDLEFVVSVAAEVVPGSLPMLSGLPMKRRCASSGVLVPMHAMVPEGVEAEHGAGNMRNSIQFRWPDDLQRLFLQPVNPIF